MTPVGGSSVRIPAVTVRHVCWLSNPEKLQQVHMTILSTVPLEGYHFVIFFFQFFIKLLLVRKVRWQCNLHIFNTNRYAPTFQTNNILYVNPICFVFFVTGYLDATEDSMTQVIVLSTR